MSVQISKSWKGFSNIEYLIIFGDSYSDVGFRGAVSRKLPDQQNPLGIEYPGITYAEDANWVGYLATQYNSGKSPLLVYDYARGGQRTDDLHSQLQQYSTQFENSGQPPWSKKNSLFVTWIGINDMAFSQVVEPAIERIMDLQKKLYKDGGRNFLIIDVPPVHRTPAGDRLQLKPDVYENWNTVLRAAISKFASDHPDATVFPFSSWDTFTRILDYPTENGFADSDISKQGGLIWLDHLHPTSATHKIVAEDLAIYLRSQANLN